MKINLARLTLYNSTFVLKKNNNNNNAEENSNDLNSKNLKDDILKPRLNENVKTLEIKLHWRNLKLD